MTDLARAIADGAPSSVRRDLDALLDQYAQVAVVCEGWRVVLERATLNRPLGAEARAGTPGAPLARRRIAHWQYCLDRWLELVNDLATIQDLLAASVLQAALVPLARR